ncbi:MAG: BrnA antitoxin family protein [Alphaproteobacteria bacterium]|nr:BrnA antitoxin family protein [Alphaproteobacteria bacterium]MDE2112888.1 BrnA antitoxin family protein [Alphaproteobacteria bacterium]MDE2495296.1 BrnA antitoxin family protein [Alphaproteobacteria bacterium]
MPKITAEMRRELEALDGLPDDQIDFGDIPEWDGRGTVYIGLHYRPGKKSVTIRLDEDMVKWFKSQGKGWQTKMNWALRLYFATHRKTGAIVGKP